MNENKRMLALFISFALVVGLILVISFWPEADKTFSCGVKGEKDYEKLGSINYKQYECLSQRNEKFALVVSNDLSDDEKFSLNKAAKQTNKGIYYLSNEVSKSELKEIKKDLKTDKTSYKNNSLIVVEKGKVTHALDKLNDSTTIYNLLKEAGIAKFACNAKADEEFSNLAKLDYKTYQCLYDSDETFTLVITQSTCGYCEQYKPVINEYAGKHNIPVYYLEIDTMDSQDSQAAISSLSYFEENPEWGTPTTLAVKDKKAIANIGGYVDSDEKLDAFFKEAGLK